MLCFECWLSALLNDLLRGQHTRVRHRVRNSAMGTACWVLCLSGHKLTRARHLINKFNCSIVSNSFATLWIIDHQVPLSVGFPRQEYWSSLPFPSSGDLPNPKIKSVSPALAGGFFTTEPPEKPIWTTGKIKKSDNFKVFLKRLRAWSFHN